MDSPEPPKSVTPPPIDLAPGSPTSKPARRPAWKWVAAGAVALVVVAGLTVGTVVALNTGGSTSELRATDPNGAEACESLTLWLEGKITDDKTGKSFDVITIGSTLAEYAKDSTTPGIKATAGSDISEDPTFKAYGLPSLRFLNPERLHTACVDAGVDMPPYVKPAGA